MNILLIGGGGREHTIAHKLSQSPKLKKLYAIPGNAGIAQLGECVDLPLDDLNAVADFAKDNRIDLTIVGPEDPLVNGIVDIFQSKGLRIFGPKKDGAMLEGSKIFSKELMMENNIPTASYKYFNNSAAAKRYLEHIHPPVVIKANGLCAGKGVSIHNNKETAIQMVDDIMEDKIFGEAGNEVLIEECLTGEEASIIFFTDGINYRLLNPSQDHKRAYEYDEGPNTGGMGAYAPTKLISKRMLSIVEQRIIEPTLQALQNRNIDYRGVIYVGIMITSRGPMVLEYNVRFGDPEAQVIIPLMESDLIEVIEACLDRRLYEVELINSKQYAIGTVVASGGYPGKYEKGKQIKGLDKKDQHDEIVFYAGVQKDQDILITSGGRVLCAVGIDDNFDKAREKSLKRIKEIEFEAMFYRKDIGAKEQSRPKIGILLGSDSDVKTMKQCFEILKNFNMSYEVHISSAHRTPHRTMEFVKIWENRGVKVIICAAGLAAHLAGNVAAHTTLPVIGVPMSAGSLSGLDALLSTVQMPPGVPVATVAIGEPGAYNAAILALQMIALEDESIAAKLMEHRVQQRKRIEEKDKQLEQ